MIRAFHKRGEQTIYRRNDGHPKRFGTGRLNPCAELEISVLSLQVTWMAALKFVATG